MEKRRTEGKRSEKRKGWMEEKEEEKVQAVKAGGVDEDWFGMRRRNAEAVHGKDTGTERKVKQKE